MAIIDPVYPTDNNQGAGSSRAPNLDGLFRVPVDESSSSEGSYEDSFTTDNYSRSSTGFKTDYESVRARAVRDVAWQSFHDGQGLLASELLINASYQEREDLIELKAVRIEAESWLKTNPEEAKKIGKYGLPDGLIAHLQEKMGVDIEKMYQALDNDMTLDEINKLIEKTYKLEANSKEMQKTQLSILAWIIQSNRESLDLSKSSSSS